MQPEKQSSLLPPVFYNKSPQVRLFKPQAILLDFHGTISERRWEDHVIYPYVKQAVRQYLEKNWFNDAVQQCYYGLKDESFEQRFRHKYEDAPVISETTSDGQEVETEQLITQVSDFLQWQMNNNKRTKDTRIIERQVWRDGLVRRQIKVPVYDDVMPSLKNWRNNKCQIYVISSIEEATLKLLFASTDKGDLSQFIDGYLCSSKPGDKLTVELYGGFYQKIIKSSKDATKRNNLTHSHDTTAVKNRLPSQTDTSAESIQTPNLEKVNSFETIIEPKPILFITDSGQEAKAANQVANGTAIECLLVQRPGNRKIRTFYLSQFSYVEKFTDIRFV